MPSWASFSIRWFSFMKFNPFHIPVGNILTFSTIDFREKSVLQALVCSFKKEFMMNLRRNWWRKQKLGWLVILLILKLNKGLRFECSSRVISTSVLKTYGICLLVTLIIETKMRVIGYRFLVVGWQEAIWKDPFLYWDWKERRCHPFDWWKKSGRQGLLHWTYNFLQC